MSEVAPYLFLSLVVSVWMLYEFRHKIRAWLGL